MSHDEIPNSEQQAAGADISRRSFVYGSAAVAGAAALLGRAPLGWTPVGRPPRGRRPRPAEQLLASSQGGFTLRQASGVVSSTGSVTLNLPKYSSIAGSLLVVTLVSPYTGSDDFTAPTGTFWQFGQATECSGGRVAQWYWANNLGSLYGPHSTGAVFTLLAGQTCLGGIAEFVPPSGSIQVFLDTVGSNSGSSSATSVTPAAGAFAGSLGVFSQAEFFTSSAAGMWTLPNNYLDITEQDTGVNIWSHSWDGNLGGGPPTKISGKFSDTTDSNGWAAVLCCYRAVTVAPIGVVGGEVTNCLDLDPTGQQLIVGGDVEGCWRTANFGGNWQPANYGGIVSTTNSTQTVLATSDQISFADIKWSLLESGCIYACVGKTGSSYGAFLASEDGGCTWTQRNNLAGPQLQFYGNGTPDTTGNGPRNPNINQDADRTVNRLIAQDKAHNRLYLVTANEGGINEGVMLSTDKGVTWTSLHFNKSTVFPRCITINPSNPNELWVGMWDGGGYSGVYYCSTALTDPTHWNQIPGFPNTVADLKVVGSGNSAYLYAACEGDGIYQMPLSGGAPVSLNGPAGGTFGGPDMNAIDTTTNAKGAPNSVWVSIDGYEETVNQLTVHQIVAGCSGGANVSTNYTNIVQLTLTLGTTNVSYTDLTGPAAINTDTVPPFGDAWWDAGESWEFWLGSTNDQSVNPHILIDPNTVGDPNGPAIYVTNSGGFFRFYRGTDGGLNWQMAVTGMPMIGHHCFAIDNTPIGTNLPGTHFVHCGDDYTSIDVNGDPSGNTPGDIISTDPAKNIASGQNLTGGHRESHAVAIDPYDSRVYLGLNYAYSQNNGGSVLWRVQSPGTTRNLSQWTDTLYAAQVAGLLSIKDPNNAPAVIGLIAGSTGTSQNVQRWAVAIAQSLPAQPQAQPPQPAHPGAAYHWDGSNWVVSTGDPTYPLLGSGGQVGQHIPIVACNTPGLLYCFDRKQGIYRSTNYGQNWTQIYPANLSNPIWKGTTSDERTGWIAVSPTSDSELWLSADSGLYRMTNASDPKSLGAMGGGVFAGGAAGVAFAPNGDLYAIALPAATPPAPTVTTLYVATDGGASGQNAADWADYCNGDGSFGSYAPPAGQLGISSTGWLWVTGGEHFGCYTQVPTI